MTLIFLVFSAISHAQISGLKINNLNPELHFMPRDTISPEVSIMHPVFNEATLPFFCKWEHKSDKSSSLKLRFRLGSVDYVDRLEKKD